MQRFCQQAVHRPPVITVPDSRRVRRGYRLSGFQYFGHINTARDRDVNARTAGKVGEGECLSCFDFKAAPVGLLNAIDQRRHICTGHGHRGILGEGQFRPHKNRFQYGSVFIVADQPVGAAAGEPVHSAGNRNTEMKIPLSTQILHRSGKSGVDNINAHTAPPALLCCSRPCLFQIPPVRSAQV